MYVLPRCFICMEREGQHWGDSRSPVVMEKFTDAVTEATTTKKRLCVFVIGTRLHKLLQHFKSMSICFGFKGSSSFIRWLEIALAGMARLYYKHYAISSEPPEWRLLSKTEIQFACVERGIISTLFWLKSFSAFISESLYWIKFDIFSGPIHWRIMLTFFFFFFFLPYKVKQLSLPLPIQHCATCMFLWCTHILNQYWF